MLIYLSTQYLHSLDVSYLYFPFALEIVLKATLSGNCDLASLIESATTSGYSRSSKIHSLIAKFDNVFSCLMYLKLDLMLSNMSFATNPLLAFRSLNLHIRLYCKSKESKVLFSTSDSPNAAKSFHSYTHSMLFIPLNCLEGPVS